MIYEYAVNPALCADWRDLRELLQSFGRGEGRLLCDMPRNEWKRLALDAIKGAQPKPVMKKRLKLNLRKLLKKASYTRASTIKTKADWLENAKATHANWPFRAILTNGYTGNDSSVIQNDIDLPSHNLWKTPPSLTVARQAGTMVDAINPLLENARQVMLIDRNFRLVDANSNAISRFKNVLIEIVNRLANKQYGPSVDRLNYHIGNQHCDSAELLRQCNLHLLQYIPANFQVSFSIWNKDDLHDRFVLTDIGGVDFGQGLDEWTGSGPKRVRISRLSNTDYKEWWSACHQKEFDVTI